MLFLACRMVQAELQNARWAMLGAAGVMLTSVSGTAAAAGFPGVEALRFCS